VYDDVADAAALEAIASGDEAAFRRLQERYAGLLFASIRRILDDPADTERCFRKS
jgi:hypothetical protein